MDQLRWKRKGAGGGILPDPQAQALKREPGRRRRTGPAKRRLRLLNATGLCGAGKRRRKTARSSTHTPKTMTAKQRRINKRRLASVAAMKERLAAKAAA